MPIVHDLMFYQNSQGTTAEQIKNIFLKKNNQNHSIAHKKNLMNMNPVGSKKSFAFLVQIPTETPRHEFPASKGKTRETLW